MPVEPNTGMELPYKGEPGYDEAKAQFPELYAAEEQGMMEGGAPPEGMPGDEGPDDMGADPAMMQASAGPMPEKPYSMNAVKTLLKELNKVLDAFSGQDIPDIEIDFESKGAKLEGPLPAELFATLVAIAETLRLLGEDFVEKHGFDPQSLMTDADLRKATASLKKMGKDKKLIEAMQAPADMGAAPEMDMQGGADPSILDEDEQQLAAAMG